MIVAVTGSNGFVGKKLVSELKKEDFKVVEIDLTLGIDITNYNDCLKIPEFDLIIHLAGKSYVPDSYKYPQEFYKTNYIGTLNMLELCRVNNAKMIFTSSYVYGVPQYQPIDEKHPLSAFNPYADSKLQGERLCESYNKFFNIKCFIVRPFNIYGKGQHDNFLISTIFNQAKTGKIHLNDPKPKRDYIHIDDIIRAFMLIVKSTDFNFEIVNLGSGVSHSVEEVTQLINKQFNNNLQISFAGSDRPNEVNDTIADIRKAKQLLGWEPEISFKEGIIRYFNGSN